MVIDIKSVLDDILGHFRRFLSVHVYYMLLMDGITRRMSLKCNVMSLFVLYCLSCLNCSKHPMDKAFQRIRSTSHHGTF
nr:MAG TPA: hypothetical protein [Caudoviricetes sp.]DAU10172.1 MAG TPA: hypothetical protein [Caudoviricetes sp.]